MTDRSSKDDLNKALDRLRLIMRIGWGEAVTPTMAAALLAALEKSPGETAAVDLTTEIDELREYAEVSTPQLRAHLFRVAGEIEAKVRPTPTTDAPQSPQAADMHGPCLDDPLAESLKAMEDAAFYVDSLCESNIVLTPRDCRAVLQEITRLKTGEQK